MTQPVVVWSGDVDFATASELARVIGEIVDGPGVETLVIDLTDVTFMDSVGLGTLVEARRLAQSRGVGMSLRGVPKTVRRLLHVTGLGSVFDIEEPGPQGPVDESRLPATTPPAAPDTKFDRIAVLVARLLDVPTALVSFVGRDGQVSPGAAGADPQLQQTRQLDLSLSTCKYVVDTAAPVICADLRTHAVLGDSPAVETLGIVAYAGFPLTDLDGRTVGSLCAADTKARDWTPDDLANLRELAELASTEIQLRTALARNAAKRADE